MTWLALYFVPVDSEGYPSQIGHYRLVEQLGAGGMGVVFLAEDQRLRRRVALKLIRDDVNDPEARARLTREARLAASVSHPAICQVLELGEWNEQPFLVMEFLAGEPLAARLLRERLSPSQASRIALCVVDALSVLHGHGIVHRDLKPSNIFLSPAGVKLLDFGLARPLERISAETTTVLTQAGTFVGTPHYAAPEQLTGADVDARADLFSAGVVLFEMLAGRPPFSGSTLPALMHSVMYDAPPVLTGSPAIAALDRVLHRALAKSPRERYATADELAGDLRALLPLLEGDRVAEARAVLRLAVLPFRLLRPDPEIEYLRISLADALVSSLLGRESLVVRSLLKTAAYANVLPDLRTVATDLAVDVVLTGSLLRSNDQIALHAELVSVPGGDLYWTHSTQAPLYQVLDLHDDLAQRVISSLPLSSRDQAHKPAKGPASPKAFDLYLRGMQLRMESSSWHQARSFFEEALELDPGFAAAWAECGRLNRILGKYENPADLQRAESALRKALELDPDSGAAHCYYAQLEIDLGRVGTSLLRLLERVRQRKAEPHVYAALVHACRYGGLLQESVTAHHYARRLDPTITTSVLHTYYMKGDFVRVIDEAYQGSDPLIARVLGAMGRETEAIAAARREETRFATMPMLRAFSTGLRAAFQGQTEEALAALEPFESFGFTDGEGWLYVAEIYARLAHLERACAALQRAIDAGFVCLPAFARDPYLAPLRNTSLWPALMEQGRSKQLSVAEEFLRADGRKLLGLSETYSTQA